jgi:hypothetical protein
MPTATKKVKKLPVKTLHGKGDVRGISVPKLRKVKEHKDYSTHLIIAGLTALFLFSAFNGWLSGEQYVK